MEPGQGQVGGIVTDETVIAGLSLRDRIAKGEVKVLSAMVFWRDPKRKPKEPWHVYKRSMRNFRLARKARMKGGPGASLLLDKVTLKIIW